MDSRLVALTAWVGEELKLDNSGIEPASADASFRRYFRVRRHPSDLIVMDAPPDKEDVRPFLQVADMLLSVGVNVPRVLARDLPRGFLLLSDLGSTQYLGPLKAGNDVDALYADALDSLARIQLRGREPAQALPRYDAAMLLREMALMPEWFFARHLGLKPSDRERTMIDAVYETLIGNAAAQPQTFVHRDYHSRNLMLCNPGNPGILDFQDAVLGPMTYDLVSLLKDCYIAWPESRVRAWALAFRARLLREGVAAGGDDAEFLRWFDLMGLQRHIKVLGIFARLWYRDGKRGYLADLPLVLRYVRDTAGRYAETRAFAGFIDQRVAPSFDAAQAREGA